MKSLTKKQIDFIMKNILCFDVILDDFEYDDIKIYYKNAENVILGKSCILNFFSEYCLEEIEEFNLQCIYDLKNYLDSLEVFKK